MSCLFLRNCTLIVYFEDRKTHRPNRRVFLKRSKRLKRSLGKFVHTFVRFTFIELYRRHFVLRNVPFATFYATRIFHPSGTSQIFRQKLVNMIFLSTKQIKMNFRRAAFSKHNYSLENQRAYLKTSLVTFLSA